MTTISPNRKRGRGVGPGSVVTVVLVLACIGLVFLFHLQLSSMLWKALSPIVSLRDSIGSSSDAQLRAELASTTAALADRNELYAQNVMLKQLLGRSITNSTVLAAVLQKPPGIPYDTLILDIGKNKGVSQGDLVFAGGTAVIGTIEGVYDTTSRVVLLSAPGESYDALLGGSVPLALTGQGAGSLSGEVPAGTPVTVGESVTLPGILSPFVGSVSYVNQQIGLSFITVYVQLPVDLFSLQYVEVQTQP